MTEFKIDPNKYRGLTAEEAERATEADRIRAINEDPRTQASIRNMQRREAEAKAEERRRVEESEREQQARAAAEWESERVRLLRNWQANGGTPEEFGAEWPHMKRRLIARRVEEADAEREREAFTV